ncbi:hypothetical protein [Moritella sp. Urea-trap-13]|uniref:hypothetical protein n=1 Tax=Moritella sp. Urea-trap-13 TaxID=2058327 RepID=UPI000C34EA81|nr:hypothetical protein [Moritella sp. Urea-trap-13]PKH04770.1 hypothetical protein CXF93_21390 [Moritella sp. Urea-trap-13]
MSNDRPIFSKNLKKELIKENQESVDKSLNLNFGASPSLKQFLSTTTDSSHFVSKFEEHVFFPVNFRDALKDDYSLVLNLFKESVEIHNKYIAGGKFPNDVFEWFNQPEISNFQTKLYKVFSSVGKNLAYRKRRKTAYEAQVYLFKNVTSPLDQFTWKDGCRLDFIFHQSFDLLVQSYLSEFLGDTFCLSDKVSFHDSISFELIKVCKTPFEAAFLQEQIGLYNVRDYMIIDSVIRGISSGLTAIKNESLMSNEELLFDIYELIPLYIKSWSPDNNKIFLNDELAIFLSMEYGFPIFTIGKHDDKADVLITSTFKFYWTVTHEFKITAKLDCYSEELNILGDYVLKEFHDKLISLFSIRKPEKTNTVSEIELDGKLNDIADFTTNYYQALAVNEEVECQLANERRRVVPSMTMLAFFTFMQRIFNCKVANGKGSEMKIWRYGSKIFTLGRHKKDQKISSFFIKKILKRLEIPIDDWLRALKER